MILYNNDYPEIYKFLLSCEVKSGEVFTHSSIEEPYKAYYIAPSQNERFIEMYTEALQNKIDLHLTEKHKVFSPILININFRQNTKERLYDNKYIDYFINTYITELLKLVHYTDFNIYILEKTAPIEYKNGIYTDGFHIIIPEIITLPAIQYEIRNRLLKYADSFKIQGITNNIEDIIDEAVIERNNWLMYGSKKKDEPYAWTVARLLKSEGNNLKAIDIPTDLKKLVKTLSIRYNVSDESRYTEEGYKIIKDTKPYVPVKQDDDIIKKLFAKLSPERTDCYEDWIRLGWCIRKTK